MTPRGRAALVLGLVLIAVAMLAATVEIHAGQHACGSALSAHAPQGRFVGTTESRAEDQCDDKVTSRRWVAGVLGAAGLVIALAGAYDHRRLVA